MKIRAKILWTLLGMLSLVTLAAIVAVNRLQAAASVSATNEARDVARLMGLLAMPGTNNFSESAEQIVAKLHQTHGRDVVLLNSDQIVVADSLPSRVGKPLTEGPSNEVGMTIKDRRVRTFFEVGKRPAGRQAHRGAGRKSIRRGRWSGGPPVRSALR